MNTNESIGPDPSALGRSSHLRILTVNFNTVRHFHEGPGGKSVKWATSSGEQCEAKFEHEKPELKPHVLNGERVEWINPTDQTCIIKFDEVECPTLPFEDGKREITIAPGTSVFSDVTKGKGRYPYLVDFVVPPTGTEGPNLGNPVIIVK